jgi:hypothetical protein
MSWFNFHKHSWKEIARTYAKPALGVTEAKGPSLSGLFQGQTTILWECPACQELRKEILIGALMEAKHESV